MNPTNELQNLIDDAVANFSSSLPISPEVIADTCLKQLDPSSKSPPLVRWAATLEMRGLARKVLARTYEKDEGQGELFEGLQDRYPGVGPRKGWYVPRAMMVEQDYRANINRLRMEASAKLKHADGLEAELLEKLANGELSA